MAGTGDGDAAIGRSEEIVEVRDGSRIAIRPVRPGDKAAIAAGFERLSPESRYRRFFAPLQSLSADTLRYLTEIDHRDHEALIAFDAPSGEPIGVARYIRGAEPSEAEVAVVVVDDWQGRGVATALLERLVRRAREEGITHFVAIVLSDNREALELFANLAGGRVQTRRSASGHTEMVIELPEPGATLPESALGRALRAAARGTLTANPWRILTRSVRDVSERVQQARRQ